MTASSFILGIGTDLTDIRRIERLFLTYKETFTHKVFTAQERQYASRQARPALTYAKRFAAKEALSKALGYGIGSFLSWQDIQVDNDTYGRPFFSFSPKRYKTLESKIGPFSTFLSLSDEYPYAQAFVVVTRQEESLSL